MKAILEFLYKHSTYWLLFIIGIILIILSLSKEILGIIIIPDNHYLRYWVFIFGMALITIAFLLEQFGKKHKMTIGNGIVDIEFRGIKKNAKAPEGFFKKIDDQLFICGISAFNSLTDSDWMKQLLEKRKSIYLLLLNPKSEKANSMTKLYTEEPGNGRNISNEIRQVLETIKHTGLMNSGDFQLRLTDQLNMTGIVIDGYIEKNKTEDDDYQSRMRFQPLPEFAHAHKGIVIQLERGKNKTVFEYYADSFRKKWTNSIIVKQDTIDDFI